MSRWFQYEKFRTTFCLPESNAWAVGLLIELDETPIGVFLGWKGRRLRSIELRKPSDSKSATIFWRITWFFTGRIADAEGKSRAICSSRRVRTGSMPQLQKT